MTETERTDDELLNDVKNMIAAADKPVSISTVQRMLHIGYNRASRLLEAANGAPPAASESPLISDDDAEGDGEASEIETGSIEHAEVFMLGRLIEIAKKRFTHLAEPWSKCSQREQERVLADLSDDMKTAVRDAVKIIAANARVTFRAEVESVQFKGPTDVKAVMKLVNGPETHALADAAGGFVTIVIESMDELLAVPEKSLSGEPDKRPLFDESTEPEAEEIF